MVNRRKSSLIGVLLILILGVSVLMGCTAQQQSQVPTEPAQTDTQTSTAPAANEPAKTDGEALIKEAALRYFEKMPANLYKISEDDTKALLDKGELKDYLVIDITNKESYDKGHISGAIFVPFKEVGKNLDLIATNAKGKKGVLVVCVTGQTSGQTVAALNMVGIPARSVNLGMKLGWNAKKYPTVKEPTQPKPAETYDWGDKAPIKDAVEKYYAKMPGGMFDLYKISQDDLKTQLQTNPEKFVVIDVRGKEDFAKGTIKDAINIPFKEVGKNFDKIAELAKGKTAVVACYTGQTAGQTDEVLNLIGIKTVSLNRGITAGWVEEKAFPVVKPIN